MRVDNTVTKLQYARCAVGGRAPACAASEWRRRSAPVRADRRKLCRQHCECSARGCDRRNLLYVRSFFLLPPRHQPICGNAVLPSPGCTRLRIVGCTAPCTWSFSMPTAGVSRHGWLGFAGELVVSAPVLHEQVRRTWRLVYARLARRQHRCISYSNFWRRASLCVVEGAS